MFMKDDWRKVLLRPNEPLSKAIEVLDKEDYKIVLVVDELNRLLGTVTDGDVRRALIRHCEMKTEINEFMHKNPKFAHINEDRKKILHNLKENNLLQMPLVDGQGVLVGLETYRHLTEKSSYDNPVFLMAGGFGKRLHPLTLETPKPLLKVGSKPILQIILESFIDAGFHRFYISTHYKSEKVRDHFRNGDLWDVSIEYVHEEEPLGTAGALGLLPDDIPNIPIIMMNGDLLTKVNFELLLQYHKEAGGLATMCVREYDFEVPYGVVSVNQNRIKRIVEKPVHKFFVNAGIYVINPELFRSIRRNSYIDMPDFLQNKVEQGVQINMFPIHEYWLDIGRMEDFVLAQNDIL
jgi:dTDP-glucose pyrophosphorylase/predicted transcriptional regulator